MRAVLILSLFIIAFSCTSKNADKNTPLSQKKAINKQKELYSFLNPYYLSYFIEDLDIRYYPFIFNPSTTTNLSKANFFVKNGRLPNNISEKYTYLFNPEGNMVSLAHFSQATSFQPYTDFIFNYGNHGISKMDILKYMQTVNQPPYYYTQDSLKSVVIMPKTAIYIDSTYFLPSFTAPEVIYTRSNNKTIDLQLYFPIGTTLTQIKEKIEEKKATIGISDFTYIYVTYTDNNLPIETYEMTANFDFGFKVKTWEYNKNWFPVRYKEYMMANLIKDLSISYNQDNLPDYITVNKKYFYSHYEYHHAD